MALHDLVTGAPPTLFWAGSGTLAAAAAATLVMGARWLHRATLIANTSTSLLRSAAQGFGEFEGRVALLPGPSIHAPLTGTVCAWYHCQVMERSDGDQRRWERVGEYLSDSLFLLRDHTGECAVDPDGAQVTPSKSLVWYSDSLLTGVPPALGSRWFASGRYRFTERRIDLGTRLYVMGHFATHGASQEVPDTPAEVRSLLSQWKRDYPALLRRFDADGDGQIGLAEWQVVQKAAHVEVRRQQRERFGGGTVNLISRPGNGLAFVISAMDQETLIRRGRRRALLAFGIFIGATAFVAWAVATRLSAAGVGL